MATHTTCDACGARISGPTLDLGDDGDYCGECIAAVVHSVLKNPEALAEAKKRYAARPPATWSPSSSDAALLAAFQIPATAIAERVGKGASVKEAVRAVLLERRQGAAADRSKVRAQTRQDIARAALDKVAVNRAQRRLMRKQRAIGQPKLLAAPSSPAPKGRAQ